MAIRPTPARQRAGERILDGALLLFNSRGTSAVTTNHIAQHIGISPGNLYYWYADKQEIIRALWERLAADRARYWEFDDALPAPHAVLTRLAESSAVAEAFAFLTRELDGLAHADPRLREAVTTDRDRRRAMLMTLARAWRTDAVLRPVPDTVLADVVRMLATVADGGGRAGVDPSTPAESGRLLGVVLEPYLTP